MIFITFLFMFSAYFVFHCLNMFYVEKQVLEFLATHSGYLRKLPVLATRFGDLKVVSSSSERVASSHRRVSRLTRDSARDSPITKRPKSAF